MIDSQHVLEALVAGREYLRDPEHWWGAGRPRENGDALGRLCAAQAVIWNVGAIPIFLAAGNACTPPPFRKRDLYLTAMHELDLSAAALFSMRIVTVNDTIGRQAVLRCYNDAIARVQATIMQPTAMDEELVLAGD